MSLIAPYILKSEYACTHCGKLPVDLYGRDGELNAPYALFFDTFRAIRELWGRAIPVISGYRCPDHNKTVGGEDLSAHLFGLALDLDCKDADEVEMLKNTIILIHPELRIGTYVIGKSFIHIDSAYLIYPRATLDWQEGVRWTK